MAKFNLGETVIFIDADYPHRYLIGEECEVIGLLDGSHTKFKTAQHYRISLKHKGETIGCIEECLRKKPKEEPATWQEIQEISGWSPTKEVAL